jgi:ribosomal protein S18 acetylase RimI-like enzyme
MGIVYDNNLPDKDGYFELFETTGWNLDYRVDADQLLEVIRNSWYHISAYDGDKLVGFGRMLSDGLLHAVIFDVIVHPDCQGRGIGLYIMNDLVEKCRAHKIRDIQLFCARGKVDFYQGCGFVNRPDDGPGMEIKTIY